MGGTDGTSALSTTELFNGDHWRPVLPLPLALEGPCVVQINSTHTFVAGGLFEGAHWRSDAFLFDWERWSWVEAEPMGQEREEFVRDGEEQSVSVDELLDTPIAHVVYTYKSTFSKVDCPL